MTPTQLQELLETEPARVLLEGAEERGFVLPAELEAFALEHDLAEDEVELLTRELETNGLEVREPAEEPAEPAAEKPEAPQPAQPQPQALVGAAAGRSVAPLGETKGHRFRFDSEPADRIA